MDNQARAHLIISGRVQGVFYRMETKMAAERIGVTGWVRNKPDGTVEAVAEGDKKAIEALIDWCHQGPPASRVENIDVRWLAYQAAFDKFDVTYDG